MVEHKKTQPLQVGVATGLILPCQIIIPPKRRDSEGGWDVTSLALCSRTLNGSIAAKSLCREVVVAYQERKR